jgi:thioredoxin-like negative regulator of GroEL
MDIALAIAGLASAAADPAVRAQSLTSLHPPATRTVKATPATLLGMAEDLVRGGRGDEAERLLTLLSDDPNMDVRNEARFRRAKMLVQRGASRDAALLLRRVLDESPHAAPVRLHLAQLLDHLGDKDAAWRELRAAQAGRLPPAVARLIDRYSEALRAARRSGATIEIALAPDSNMNRATRGDTLGTVIGDFAIAEESKAKSGTGLSLRGQAFGRHPIGLADGNLLLRVNALADIYPRKAFNEVALSIAAGPELKVGRNRLNAEVELAQRWLGQEPFMRWASVGATWTQPLDRRTQARLSASSALVDNQLSDLHDGKAFSAKLSLERALTTNLGLILSLGGDRQNLEERAYSTKAWKTGATLWRDVGRATVTAGVEIGRLRADERLALFPDRRSDRSSRLSFAAVFRQVQLQGLAPVTRLIVERNRSSVEYYDYKRTRMEFGVVRAF